MHILDIAGDPIIVAFAGRVASFLYLEDVVALQRAAKRLRAAYADPGPPARHRAEL